MKRRRKKRNEKKEKSAETLRFCDGINLREIKHIRIKGKYCTIYNICERKREGEGKEIEKCWDLEIFALVFKNTGKIMFHVSH